MKFIVFLLCCAAVSWTFAESSIDKNADLPEELIQGSYFIFNGNSSETHECLCSYGDPSEFDYSCELSPKTFDADLLPAPRIPCDEIPYRVAAHLSINCSGCRECVTLDLRQLTLRHDKTQMGVQVYPPPAVNIFNCQVISANVDARQLQLEKVNLSDKMKVAQFGIPERPGVGGYYTVEVTYPNNFNESDCWLKYLKLDTVDIWYLPEYLMYRCQSLHSIQIWNTPITWVSVKGLMALRNIDSLTMAHCSVTEFGSDALQITLDALDKLVAQRVQNGTKGIDGNNLTQRAVDKLEQMYNASGRLNKVTYLYDMMDNDNIDFSLVFGHQEFHESDKQNLSKQVPWGVKLSYLNLANNMLTEIPYSLSLFGNLQTVNLSHNRISGLYRDWICWPPPVRNGTDNNRHCYWFRASAQTLKILDLSYNRIELIGEIQPWYNVQLAELYLQGNQITTINPEAFAKSRLKSSLLVLNLDDNKLTYFLLSSLERLEEISIQHNQLGNVQYDSVPRSSQLHRVKLANNCITAIETGAFNNLKMLDFIDLSNNNLRHIYYDSMTMTKRTTLGSRVVLYAKNQQNNLVCDCGSVYMKTFEEEENSPWAEHSEYHYPRIPDEEMDSNCTFFDPNRGKVNLSLREAKQQSVRFLCNFEGKKKHKLPSKNCTDPTKCWVYCMAGCSCYHNEDWTFFDLQCQNKSLSLSQLVIDYPVKKIDMSDIHGVDSLRHISSGTFKWKPQSFSAQLEFLKLSNSGIVYIENGAFNFDHRLTRIELDHNRIKSFKKESICTFANNTQRISLKNNNMTTLDVEIFNENCLPSLMDITLSDNPWQCSCTKEWLQLHQTLLQVSKSTQVVSDFQRMTCSVDQVIIDACTANSHDHKWNGACEKLGNSTDYQVSDEGRLVKVCELIANSAAQQRKQTVRIVLTSAFGLVLLGLAMLAVRRRHRLLAVVRVLILLKYQSSRRLQQQASRDSLPYDAMLWASDRDQDCLVDVLNCVRSASGGDELELCVPESFLYSDLCSCPLTYFDCPAEGAKFSGKVVVALTERFLDTQYLALCQVIRELDSVGRNPFKDIVFLRLSSRRVSLQRQRQLGPEDVEAFHTLQKILRGCDIVYKSVDWEYRLIERIRNRDPAAVLVFDSSVPPETSAAATPAVADRLDITVGTASEPEELLDLPGEGQPLIVDVEQTIDFIRSRTILSTIRDWPPFHSDKVPEVFILSAPESASDSESRADPDSSSNTVVELIVRRLSGVRLGTNDAALTDRWPDNFEPTSPASRINSFLMKRTRQFVLLLSNGLLSWLRDEAELQCEFQAFLAANSFRRRLLVVQVGQLDSRSRARYRALANQRLDGGESGSATNWFDMSAEDCDVEALGLWLDGVLYKKADLRK